MDDQQSALKFVAKALDLFYIKNKSNYTYQYIIKGLKNIHFD